MNEERRPHGPNPDDNPSRDRRVWEGLLHAGPGEDLLVSTFWGTEALNLEAFVNHRVRITIEVLDPSG